jgi:serine-protein kinase ATM
LKNESKSESKELLGKVYFTVGKWLNQTKTEGVRDIINNYLADAVKYSKDQSKAYFTLAKYFDHIYTDIIRKMKSDEYKNLSEIRTNNEKLLKEYEKSSTQKGIDSEKKREIERQIRSLKKISSNDQKEKDELKKKCHISMTQAMENYGRSSAKSSKYDLHIVFRICSLWLTNAANESTEDYNKDVNSVFETLLKIIKPHKFIPLVYQIASRMGSHSTEFQKLNMKLLKNLVKKHPHHSLFQIFALYNGDRLPGDQHSKDFVVVDEQKIKSAKELINQMRTESKEIIEEYESLIEAYIEIAFLPLDPKKFRNETNPIKFDSSLKITKIKSLKNMPIPTIDIEPQTDEIYQHFNSVEKFDSTFTLAGGVNLPKIVNCYTSNGSKFRQLVKGKDDLRQDAVFHYFLI